MIKLFSNLFSSTSVNLEEELKSLVKAQELLDERFRKKLVSPETYKQKSLEFMAKRDKIQAKIDKIDM